MATIDSLNISILKMPFEQAFNLIKSLRDSRRIKKTTKLFVSRTPKKGKGTKAKTKTNPIDLLTTEQKAKLFAELTGGIDD